MSYLRVLLGYAMGSACCAAWLVGCGDHGETENAGGQRDAGAGGSRAGGSGGGGPGSSGGLSGTGGFGPTGTPVECAIEANATLSPAIATVGIVTWSTDLEGIDNARIEFGLAETGPTMAAPVDLSAPGYRTLLLGMKGDRDYVFRIVVNSGSETCTSERHTLTTGPVSNSVPVITRQVVNAAAVARGFIVTSGGVGAFGVAPGGATVPVFIMDSDGDVVWWASAPVNTGRARMSWEGDAMWMMEVNVENAGADLRRVSMDGLEVEAAVEGLSRGHHDFTVAPDGVVTAIVWNDGCSGIVERSADGTITTIVENVSLLYQTDRDCHTNAIQYQPWDDTYTLSDRNVNLFVKIDRQGRLLWQFGGTHPRSHLFVGSWEVNHGHHLQENGNFLFFNNGNMGSPSAVLEYHLNETTWEATPIWEYRASPSSATLGDAQRLPNGNTLVTYSNQGVIHEVDPAGNLVQSLTTSSLGYANFRSSLYGPPLR